MHSALLSTSASGTSVKGKVADIKVRQVSSHKMMLTHLARAAGDVVLLDTTKELIHSALLSPTASGALVNGEALDKKADDEFSDEVSAAIVDWIAKRMSDYHKNFHDTQLMQVKLAGLCAVCSRHV